MKKLLTRILAVCLVALTFVLCACAQKPAPKEVSPFVNENQVAVVINNGKYTATYTVTLGEQLSATTAKDVLNYLQQNGAFTIDWSGDFINAIADLQPDSDQRQFVTVLTSIKQYQSTEADALTYTMGEIEIVSSNKGVAELPATGGSIVWFEIATW